MLNIVLLAVDALNTIRRDTADLKIGLVVEKTLKQLETSRSSFREQDISSWM